LTPNPISRNVSSIAMFIAMPPATPAISVLTCEGFIYLHVERRDQPESNDRLDYLIQFSILLLILSDLLISMSQP